MSEIVLPTDKGKLLDLAAGTWEKLTGQKIDSTSVSGTIRDYYVYSDNKELMEAAKLDVTAVTAIMMIGAMARDYAEKLEISLSSFDKDSSDFLEKLNLLRTIQAIVGSSELTPQITSFVESMRKAAEHYGVLTDGVKSILDTKHDQLAYIRRDAVRAMEILKVDQFMAGKGEPPEMKAKYNTGVYLCMNPNSLVEVLCTQLVSGISLVMIKDDEIPEYSFFAFSLRNGQNVFLLHDQQDFNNPEQKHWRRNPGRDMERRIFKMRFPYQLLELTWDSKGHLYVERGEKDKVVKFQSELVEVKKLQDLEPDQILWLIMMFELIEQKFWKQNYQALSLSYTAEMITVPNLLDTHIQALEVVGHKMIEAPVVTKESISSEVMGPTFGCKPTYHNQWLEKHYMSQIDEKKLLYIGEVPASDKLLSNGEAAVSVRGSDPQEIPFKAMPIVNFGSQARLEKDSKWYARWNLTMQLNILIKRDFDSEYPKIKTWYEEKVRANADSLKTAIAKGEMVVRGKEHFKKGDWFDTKLDYTETNILSLSFKKQTYWSSDIWRVEVALHGGYNKQYGEFHCFGQPKSIGRLKAIFLPRNPEGIAALAGCKVEELSVFLQNWYKSQPYTGNSILDDVDPMEWAIKNPFLECSWGVGIVMCKRTYYHWQKVYLGQVKHRFDKEEEDD